MSAYDRLSKKDRRYARRARAAGVPPGWASMVVEAAIKAGIPRSRGLALVQTESNFANVFGHDPVQSMVGGPVTEPRYRTYTTRRKQGLGMQGVGPCQLTWWELQDEADRQGGCWRPEVNMNVAFEHLKALTRRYGVADGIRRYNGSGPAADVYSKTVRRRERQWRLVLLGLSRKRPS